MEKVLIDQAGPLPISVDFEGPGDLPVTFHFCGSAYSTSGSEMIGVTLALDGADKGSSTIYANPEETHLATVPKAIQVNLDPKDDVPTSHTIELTNFGANAVTDVNDWFTLVMSY